MSKDSVPAGQFLAYIEYLKPDQSNRFARLRPIYEIAKKSWRPIKDGNSLFLDEGLVFWWNPVSLASEGALWVVTLQSQHGYGSDFKHKDKFAVADARRPYQAITLQDVPGQKTFRRVLATGRFSIDTPIVGRPLVAIPGEVGRWIILPDSFRTSTHKEHVLITVPELEGVIPIYSVDTEAFEQIVVGAHHYSLSLVPGEAISYQCTLSDAQLIKHMRKRISSIDRTVLDGLDVTKKLLRKYLEVIDAAELGGGDAAKERVRREALISLVEGFDAEVDHIDKVVEILMEYPPFQERLEARSEKVLQQLREEKEKELIEEQHTANNRLSETRKKIEAATRQLDALHTSISAAVSDIIESPIEALARHGLLDAVKRSFKTESVHPTLERSTTSATVDIKVIENSESLKKAVVAWSYNTGVDPYVMQISLSAVMAHRITLISGAHSERLAVALASTVAGECAVRVSVNTAVFGIGDLMNAPVNPVGATYFERSYTLGEFFVERGCDGPILVILSGCNRAPPEVILPELLLPMGGGANAICWSRTETQISTAVLSSRLKVIGTLHNGDATYGIPSELSRQLAFVPSDHQEMEGIQLPAHPVPAPSRINNSLWDALQTPLDGVEVGAFVTWLIANGVGLPADVLSKVLTSYLNLTANPQVAIAEAIAGVLLGRDPDWKIKDIPGAEPETILQRLSNLSKSPAWQEARCYFNIGNDE